MSGREGRRKASFVLSYHVAKTSIKPAPLRSQFLIFIFRTSSQIAGLRPIHGLVCANAGRIGMLGHLSARCLLGQHAYSTLSVGHAGPVVRTSIHHTIHIVWESFQVANQPHRTGIRSASVHEVSYYRRDQL
jgi:hypothetical protein